MFDNWEPFDDEPSTYPKKQRIASSSNVDNERKPSQRDTIIYRDSIKDRRKPLKWANKYNLMYGRYNLFLIIYIWIIFIVIQIFEPDIGPHYCHDTYSPNGDEGEIDGCEADRFCQLCDASDEYNSKCCQLYDFWYRRAIINWFYALLG